MTTLRDAAKKALTSLENAIQDWTDEMEYRSCVSVADEWAASAKALRTALDADSMASLPEPKPYWVTERQIDRNEIVKMARAAGFFYSSGGSEYMLCRIPNLERLTALIVAAKREWKGLVDTEPVAWRTFDGEGGYEFRDYDDNENYRQEFIERNGEQYASWVAPLYTAPPRRKWQGLTAEDHEAFCIRSNLHPVIAQTLAEYIEAKLKEKNT